MGTACNRMRIENMWGTFIPLQLAAVDHSGALDPAAGARGVLSGERANGREGNAHVSLGNSFLRYLLPSAWIRPWSGFSPILKIRSTTSIPSTTCANGEKSMPSKFVLSEKLQSRKSSSVSSAAAAERRGGGGGRLAGALDEHLRGPRVLAARRK